MESPERFVFQMFKPTEILQFRNYRSPLESTQHPYMFSRTLSKRSCSTRCTVPENPAVPVRFFRNFGAVLKT